MLSILFTLCNLDEYVIGQKPNKILFTYIPKALQKMYINFRPNYINVPRVPYDYCFLIHSQDILLCFKLANYITINIQCTYFSFSYVHCNLCLLQIKINIFYQKHLCSTFSFVIIIWHLK